MQRWHGNIESLVTELIVYGLFMGIGHQLSCIKRRHHPVSIDDGFGKSYNQILEFSG